MSKPLVVITGASSGIGAATARALSAAGHPLLLLARNVEPLNALQLPHTLCEPVDVTNVTSFQAAIDKAVSQYGDVDCLINNAGTMLLGHVASQQPSEWKTMLDVNVLGVLNGIHCVLARMMEKQQGTIINISSIAGRKTFPNHAAYCASKFAVHALSENIREEVAKDKVRVVTIAPGIVDTALLSHTTSDDIKQDYEAWKATLDSVLSPDDVAAAILFAYSQPQCVCVREIVLATTTQEP
tara:strand:+ start:14825 stop:15547 length:723 start_codon:yes stop_codon:yes gene_type:complete